MKAVVKTLVGWDRRDEQDRRRFLNRFELIIATTAAREISLFEVKHYRAHFDGKSRR